MLISVTLAVLKLVTSSEMRPEQPSNIPLILVTFPVLKCVTSSEVSEEQPLNINFIFVTFSVLRFSMPSICFSLMKFWNHA